MTTHSLLQACCGFLACAATAFSAGTPVESLTFNGQVDTNQASFMLTGRLRGQGPEDQEPKLIYSLATSDKVTVDKDGVSQQCSLTAKIHQGKLKELVLAMNGKGDVTNVTGISLKDWGVRYDAQGRKFLVLRPPDPGTNAPKEFTATITARLPLKKLPAEFTPLSFVPENAALFDGSLEIKPADSVELSLTNIAGLMLVRTETALAPVPDVSAPAAGPLQFRFAGGEYSLTVQVRERDSDGRKVNWEKFQLTGELQALKAAFTLTGEAVVRHPEGGTLPVLAGDAALTACPTNVEMKYEQGRYVLVFRKPGTYPLELKFHARVSPQGEWNNVSFDVAASSLRPVTLKGLPGDTQFQFAGAARPERQGEDFVSFLPSAGRVQLQWKEAKKEELGRLFYSVQGTVQIAVGPGLLRQAYLMDYKVMQGELTQLVFELAGDGEVTRVRGNDVVSWTIGAPDANKKRQLTVKLNQPRKDGCQVLIQAQSPLGNFPLQAQPLRITPAQAIRYGGSLLVANDGAVRIEVTESRGLSQISPDLFPQGKEMAEAGLARGTQAFAYRFAGSDYSLALQADHILPELSVSQVVVYHLSETESIIDAELELEIRDAPLREFAVRIPSGYTVARLTAPQLADHFETPETGTNAARMRLVFTAPLTGRQVIQFRLSTNQTAVAGAWTLPVIAPQGVKSLRGHLGVSSDTGFRITAGPLTGLTELAPALFPRKLAGLQLAWRLREDTWSAAVNVQRLAQTIQADVVHLFSLKEGIAYGSSVINYMVAGSPVSTFKVAVPTNYGNVEFAGKEVRNWKKTEAGYEVYLHTPVFGAYTLLATYDRQFSSRSNQVVAFEGARPLDPQTEQGTVFVVSELQIEAKPTEVSRNLMKLDPLEIAPEHRLLFDAPILAAYQYTTRPYALALALSSLPPGETMHQVADRAVLQTRITREGEVMTMAQYFLKNQGYAHLRLKLPPSTRLWEVRVNDEKKVPVTDGAETLIPLPARANPTAVLKVDIKLTGRSPKRDLVELATPALSSPVLQTEWRLMPDEQYRLQFRGGGVRPVELQQESSGFAWLRHLLTSESASGLRLALYFIPALVLLAALSLRLGTRAGVCRWSQPNLCGLLAGLVFCTAALYLLGYLAYQASQQPAVIPTALTFIAPIQEPQQFLAVVVGNLRADSQGAALQPAWPALLALLLWSYLAVRNVAGFPRRLGVMAGWTLAGWAALRLPNGGCPFMLVLAAFVLIQIVLPGIRCQKMLAPKPAEPPAPEAPSAPSAPAPTTALLVLAGLLAGGLSATAADRLPEPTNGIVQSVVQEGQVRDGFVFLKAQLIWRAEAGQKLDFLSAPAVLTKTAYPENALVLGESKSGDQPVYRLTARESGRFEIRFEYQIPVPRDAVNNGFFLPTPSGLANRLTLEIDRPEMEVFSAEAVSVESSKGKSGDKETSRAEVVLAPAARPQISWRPRARDFRLEKAVFYAELYHLYVPTPGVVEGYHVVQVRPAQGQLSEVSFLVPTNLTITDVQGDAVANWRFDPDQQALRAQFSAPQAKPFTMRLRSQMTAGALPYQQSAGVITLSQAASQLGMAGVASGGEVQVDSTTPQAMSPINLEDFAATAAIQEAARQIPALTLRRAYRYSEASAQLAFSASPVQPDVRVTTQERISLSEDRILLASQLDVAITRAGIFKLSFVLPAGFEVETLTGSALSHWTEQKSNENRIILLHLRGKTEGAQTFNATLAGPGLGGRKEWTAPRLTLLEAAKQTGVLLLSPEQGMRLQPKTRDGLNELDAKKAGVTQSGAKVFNLLHARWVLAFEVESVEPWIQAFALQDVNLREGQAQVAVNLEYQIDNAGVKSLFLQVPTNAENVRFEGDLISDSVKGTNIARWMEWEVKLQRRVIGAHSLRVLYQLPLASQAAEMRLSGVRARNANLQRGFLAVRAGGRLQLKFPQVPATLQAAEWQSIPAILRRGKDLAEARDTFSVLETDFELPVQLQRHQLAELLPAQVESIALTSVVAPSGEMLTEGRLRLHPGDLRLLRMKLPAGSKFWYAFVNGQSAWPWRDRDQHVLMLEKNTDPKQPTQVEFFYTCPTGDAGARGFSHQLLGPSFALPLQNLSWNVYVPAGWEVKDWESSLQLRGQGGTVWPATLDLNGYLQAETARQREQSQTAVRLLQMGNQYLQGGTPQEARRAYEAAWKMSPQDAAFNEDARVQLHNVKMQQALLGLNQRRQVAFETAGGRDARAARAPFNRWEAGQAPEYTQQQAQQVLEQNSEDDNAALYRLAERLIRQQSAGTIKPESIRAALPEQGRLYQFSGSLQASDWADLKVKLDVRQNAGAKWSSGGWFLAGLFAGLLLLALAVRQPASMKTDR